MSTLVRLYACAITLAIWAACWWGGLRGDIAVGVFLIAVAIAVALGELERSDQRQLRKKERR